MCMHELGLISSGEHAWVKPFSFAKGEGRQKRRWEGEPYMVGGVETLEAGPGMIRLS